MILAIEIIAVIVAFAVLVIFGIKMVKKAVGFGRSAKMMNEHSQPQIMALMTQSDMAQQRVFSITGNADKFQRILESLPVSFRRLIVVIGAIREVSASFSRGIRSLGY